MDEVKDRISFAGAISMFDLEPPKGQTWRCPFPEGHNHHDRMRSASIYRGKDGRERFICFACGRRGDVINLAAMILGCDNGDAMRYLAHRAGIRSEAPQVRPRPELVEYRAAQKRVPAVDKPPLGEMVKAYNYHDEDGVLLYQVCRFDPKDFRQRRPDGDGGWVWNLRGTRRVLYRLPHVIEALKRGDPIWLCEGEKDADALVEQGYCATTNVGGAGKWDDSYTDLLTGARVVIVRDNDHAGRSHAEALQLALEGRAQVWVVEPPEGKDVAEMLGRGLPVSALREAQ